MRKEKKSVQQKVEEDMPEFVTEVASLSADQLNNRLAALAKSAEELEEAKDDDEDLQVARETASELGAPYRDAKRAIKLKNKYIIGLIKERGAQ